MEILTLGEKIRRKRKTLRLTLKDVAANSVTPAQLSYVESNKCKPSSGLLKYICEKLELDMDYLLENEIQQVRKHCEYFMREYEFYIRRGERKEACEKLLEIEKFAAEYSLDEYMATVVYKKGINALLNNNYDYAEQNILTAKQLFMKLKNNEYVAYCYFQLGLIYLYRNYYDDSMLFLNQSLNLIQRVDICDNSLLYKIPLNIAKIYYKAGKISECRQNLINSIESAKKICGSIELAEILEDAVFMLREDAEASECEEYINEAERVYRSNGYFSKIAVLDTIRSLLFIKSGDYEKAYNKLISVCSSLSQQSEYKAYAYLLEACANLIDRGCKDYAEMILSHIDTIPNTELSITQLYLKSRIYKDNDIEKSRRFLVECLACLNNHNKKEMAVKVLTDIGEIFRTEKKFTEAYENLLRAAKLYDIVDAL